MSDEKRPPGWALATLGEVSDVVGGLAKGKKRKADDEIVDVPYLRVANVQRGYLRLTEVRRIKATTAEVEKLRLLPGDVLFTEGGDRDKLGRGWIWNDEVPGCIHQNHIFRARLLSRCIQPKFVSWFGNQEGAAYFLRGGKQTTNLASISMTKLRGLPLRLPPAEEQRRIVEKIEALMARSRRAKEALDAIPPLLERFRMSVLAAAFRGDLTADWRAQNPDVEPADQLLERIRVERRRRWEEGYLEKQRAKGKEPKNDKWKAKYKEADPLGGEFTVHTVPRSWRCVALTAVCAGFSYGTSKKSVKEGQAPVLRMGNLQGGEIDWTDLAYTNDADEISAYRLSPMSVLFNRTNSPRLVGKTAIYRGERDAIYAGYLIHVRNLGLIDAEYLNLALNSPHARTWCWLVKSDGVSQSNISASKLAGFPFPLCPLAEQQEVVRRVSAMMSLLEPAETDVDVARVQVGELNRAVLAKAFRGELVPQDPNDEPASVLLGRIRAERAAAPPKKKRGRKRKAAR